MFTEKNSLHNFDQFTFESRLIYNTDLWGI